MGTLCTNFIIFGKTEVVIKQNSYSKQSLKSRKAMLFKDRKNVWQTILVVVTANTFSTSW